MQNFGISRRGQADPPRLFRERGRLAEPGAGPGKMGDIGATFSRRDRKREVASEGSGANRKFILFQ
jgi:hypothetical protein